MATHLALINIRHRFTQIVVLFASILICMLFAQTADAKPKPPRFDKPKYRTSVHSNSQRVVKVLYKKRSSDNKSSMTASSRKGKNKPMAETDTAY